MAPPTRPTVLVVDEDDLLVRTMRRALRREGLAVSPCSCGAEALALLDRNPRLDAAVVDLSMPDMPALDLLIRLRHRHPRLPVVLVSGLGERAVAERLAAMPRTAFLAKPFRPSQLLAVLEAERQG